MIIPLIQRKTKITDLHLEVMDLYGTLKIINKTNGVTNGVLIIK